MKAIKCIFFIMISAIFILSCSKNGATGPQGATGETGPQGNTGPEGPSGSPGNSTMYVIKFTVDTSQWIGLNHAYAVYYKIGIPQLNAQAVSNGTLQVFCNKDTTTWNLWTSTQPGPSANSGGESYTYSTASDTLTISYNNLFSNSTSSDFYDPLYFKVVIIVP